MQLLFLDDSYQKHTGMCGYGGYCIGQESVRALADELMAIKSQFGIPQYVELKWSPDPEHYLRTKFKGERHDLYSQMLGALRKHNATVICSVHSLDDCYGVKVHGWSREATRSWAANEQLKFIAERFQRPLLIRKNDLGIIVCDASHTAVEDKKLVQHFHGSMLGGTGYTPLDRITTQPLMVDSSISPHIQFADLVAGISVSALGGNNYAIALFEQLSLLFLTDPNEKAITYGQMFSDAVRGFGLKMFPATSSSCFAKLFVELDKKYFVTEKGLQVRT